MKKHTEILDMNGRHGSQSTMCHVYGLFELAMVSAHHASGGLISVVEEADAVDLVQLSSLSWNVGGWEVEASVEVSRLTPIHKLSDNLTVPLFVELVDHDSVIIGEVLHNADGDFEELRQIFGFAKLIGDLAQGLKNVGAFEVVSSVGSPSGTGLPDGLSSVDGALEEVGLCWLIGQAGETSPIFLAVGLFGLGGSRIEPIVLNFELDDNTLQ